MEKLNVVAVLGVKTIVDYYTFYPPNIGDYFYVDNITSYKIIDRHYNSFNPERIIIILGTK